MDTTLSTSKLTIAKFWNQAKAGRGGMLVGLVPAALITVALFLAMNALIQVRKQEAKPSPRQTLEAYMVPSKPVTARVDRIKPERLNTVVPPRVVPPAGPMNAKASIPVYFSPAPIDLSPNTNTIPLGLQPSAVPNRDVRPMQMPVLNYPHVAQRDGIEGSCEVALDVTPQGRPYNVSATCTNRVFKKEAERAVRNVMFQPGVSEGRQVGWRGVVYPIEFSFDD